MKEPIREYLFRLRKKRSRRRKLAAVLICLSLIVAGSTAWALHINGEGQTGETFCGCEEHQHTEECIEKTLVCGYDTEEAAEPETETLSVQISEPFSAGHTHTDACYETQTTLTCAEAEHTHSEENGCYDEEGNLICEISEHTHSDESGCYTTETVLVCGLEESGAEIAETETETAAEDTAEEAAEPAHVHTDECYEITYICGKEEHTHTLSCYSDPEADVETAAIWEQTVSGAELTGVYAEDLVAVAKTQLGYTESAKNYQVVLDAEGNETAETKGYTRYGAWYGIPYGDWCAMFVSFCLNYANVPETAFPRSASCPAWVEALSDPEQGYELYRAAADYSPYPGDIVFFDWDGDGSADHVGIVSGLTPEYTGTEEYYEDDPDYTLTGIVTIEGNSSDQVRTNTYGLDDSAIMGYGALSLVYGTAAQAETEIIEVASLAVDLRTATYNTTEGQYKTQNINNNGETLPSDGNYTCYEYTESNAHYYLIPVSYLEKYYKEKGFTFSAETCPFSCRTKPNDSSDSTKKWTNYVAGFYEEYSGSTYLKVACATDYSPVVYYAILTAATDTVTPSNAVIHMFDYWTTENRLDSDNHYSTENNSADLNRGINSGHVLKFGKNMGSSYGLLNYSYGGTETPSKVTAGIVENTLGADGYPALSGDTALGMAESDTYSLSYLFDPNEEAAGKESFSRVTGLLSVDSQGYFYYNSAERYAQLDEATGAFTVYNEPAGHNESLGALGLSADTYGQFYPYNDGHQVALLDNAQDPINHYFGMTLTTRFIQNNNGYTTAAHSTPTTFEFSGDNDVWIFIDGVLVADLGGLSSARSVTINFATGEVTIDDGTTDGSNPSTALYKAFDAAEKTSDVHWQINTINGKEYTTFANGTTHTLKFYYLERGNYDSNLMLKYNLTDIPATAIYKVDQYGDAVGGAAFAVYKAQENSDGTYSYLLDDNKTASSLDSYYVDPETGAVYTDKSKTTTVIAKPAYLGTTDDTGQMIFTDGDGMPYSISELKNMFGNYFFLREIKVPEGYRTVSDDVLMYIDPDVEMLQTAESPYLTGVWTSPNALVTATNTLYIANEEDYSKAGSSDGTISYYSLSNDGTWETNGTLFAVVLDRGEAGATEYDQWLPIKGNDAEGYETVKTETEGTYNNLTDAIAAAKSYGTSHVFSYAASGMQVTIEELPGELSQYYTYQEAKPGFDPDSDDAGKIKYLVAYYWTSAGSLENATAENTVRVASHDKTTGGSTTTGGFTVQWGATIEVPNVINALYFQKADESVSMLIDDAVFALYEVETATNSAGHALGYYVATAADGSAAYVRLDEDADGNTATGKATVYTSLDSTGTEGSYSIQTDNITIPETNGTGYITDEDAGVITVTVDGTNYTITPATNAQGQSLVGYTHDKCASISEDGTGHFKYIKTGNYFLKEIAAPAGYVLNSENIMVAVNDKGVYASAGDEENGVRVGNGPGYLVKTLDVFASLETIDETLSWIYGVLKVDDDHNNCFEGVNHLESEESLGVNDISYPLLSTNVTSGTGESGLTTDGGNPYSNTKAMVTYQQYDGKANVDGTTEDSIFDYVVVDNKTHNTGTVNGVAGTETIRLWTESGWSDMAIYQDYTYGNTQTLPTTEYTDLTEYGDIAHLFSSSTFVQVSDTVNLDLTVAKVTDDFYADAATENTTTVYLDDAEFTLTRYVDGSGNIVTKDTEGATVQYYDPATESWGTEEKTLTSTTTFIADGSSETQTVTTQVYAYQNDITHHLVYTKVYTINGQTYRLESIKDGTATLKPVTVTWENTQGRITTTDTGGDTLTGTLARSYFKIRGLSQGTYYLTETKVPTYTDTKNESVDFQKLSETVITISDGKYYYYEKNDNKIIVTDADDVQTDPTTKELYIELTEIAEDGTTTTTKYTVYEGNSFSVSIDGDDASYLVELDDSGTTAAYYEDNTGTLQMGFRVNNSVYQSVGADIQLVKVDKTADTSVTLPTSPGFTEDNTHFAVGEDKDTDGVGDYDSVTSLHSVLTGAEFKLYRISVDEASGEETKLYYKQNDDGTAEVTSDEADATVLKVDNKGYLKITGLKYTYVYYLVETKAPDGYNLLDHAIKVSWSYAALQISDESAMLQDAILMPYYDDQVYIVIYNESGYELPDTGGTGTTMFTAGGLFLITVTLVYGCGRRRRRERRND